jgi:hypothetical protein
MQKIGATIRLTPTALKRLAQLEINARREGLRGRSSSGSAIVEALIECPLNVLDSIITEIVKGSGARSFGKVVTVWVFRTSG